MYHTTVALKVARCDDVQCDSNNGQCDGKICNATVTMNVQCDGTMCNVTVTMCSATVYGGRAM